MVGRAVDPKGGETGRGRASRAVAHGRRAVLRRPIVSLEPLPAPRLPPLPSPLSTFVGRDATVETLVGLLSATAAGDAIRLLTLTGPGGVGKTRLALRVAGALRSAYPDGVGFVPLAAVRDPDLVPAAIAGALGLRERNRQTPEQRLATHLGDARCLLVLDNFEQVAGAAPMLPALLAACPGLALLVTSRVVLRVAGERVFSVPPLATDRQRSHSEGVRLFIERAATVRPGIKRALTDDLAAVSDLCARLDGLPLAIELAAARVSLLPPRAMLAAMDQRLPLLTAGTRDAPDRQQTMRSAIAWSYDLLPPQARTFFQQLSVFVGGFSLDAAAVVSGQVALGGAETDPPPHYPFPTPPTVLGALMELVDHSLVHPAESDDDDEPRFAVLETIREFGRERLAEAGELDAASGRHAACYLALAQALDSALSGPDQPNALRRLDRDLPNLHAALSWLLDRSDPDAFRLAAALGRYWDIRGRLSEGIAFLERVLAKPVPGRPVWRAIALNQLADLAAERGDYALAKVCLIESISLARQIGDRQALASALSSLGRVADDEGDLATARAHHEEALALRRELGDRAGIARSLSNLGNAVHAQGDFALARTLHAGSLALRRELGQPLAVAYSLLNLGDLARNERRYDDARSLLAECLTMFEHLGDPIGTAFAHHLLGRVAAACNESARALAAHLAALALRCQVEDRRGMIECVEGIAFVAAELDPAGAAKLLGAAAAQRATIGAARTPPEDPWWEEAVETVTVALGPAQFSLAWAAGQALPLSAAATEAATLAEGLLDAFPAGDSSAETDPTPNPGSPDVPAADLSRLSRREIDVLRLLTTGATNRQIAGDLHISPATAKRHVTNLLAKLGVATRAEATSLALRAGLARPHGQES